MTSIEFIEKEINETRQSYKSFDLDYNLFGRESDKRDADALMKKLIQLQQVKKDLLDYNALKIDYQISLAFQETQKEEMQSLRKELDVVIRNCM